MLTQFRLVAFAVAALIVVGAGQAFALWPFSPPLRLATTPAYGGVCEACNLAGRDLSGARMTNSVFNRSDFSNARMARTNASGSQFVGANFTETDLTFASLAGSRCANAVFQGARFHGARLVGADFSGADLRRAEGLTQYQLNEACGDQETLLPPGFSVPRCEAGES